MQLSSQQVFRTSNSFGKDCNCQGAARTLQKRFAGKASRRKLSHRILLHGQKSDSSPGVGSDTANCNVFWTLLDRDSGILARSKLPRSRDYENFSLHSLVFFG
jgi:hypothetical protein